MPRERRHARHARRPRRATRRCAGWRCWRLKRRRGVATAIVRLCEAVRRDEQVVLPVSTLAHGECGVAGVYLSLPCVIGALGVSRVLAPDLDAEERAALRASAAVLQGIMDGLETMDGREN